MVSRRSTGREKRTGSRAYLHRTRSRADGQRREDLAGMVIAAERQRRTSAATNLARLAGLSPWWMAGLIAVGGLVMRLAGLNDRSVWTDEVYALYWASQPWLEIPSILL